ncbi:hypothetical protein BJ138DRAFT_1103860 [Hygrophoropsis aurantiaca]|uniref:Uncharacterized protein n=1 Tax=Hygrophoropsis aurantiaca TaxID=72124 RepID=A0ACB8A4G6_9AGAM|nr:hypothetical protein BJ138DRAFT_1103860 [Hygrophoropsis aurantiaca]
MSGKNRSKKKGSLVSRLRKRKAEVSRRPSAFKKLRGYKDSREKIDEDLDDGDTPESMATGTLAPDKLLPSVVLTPNSRRRVGRAVAAQSEDELGSHVGDSSEDELPLAGLSQAMAVSVNTNADLDSPSDEEPHSDNVGESYSSVFNLDVEDVTSEVPQASSGSPAPIRKSMRTRKATEKMAAQVKGKKPLSTSVAFEDSVAESNVEPDVFPTYHQDITVTSRPAPDTDLSEIDDRDVMLKSTYRDLVPLRSVALVGSGSKAGGTIKLSGWPSTTKGEFNKQFVLGLVTFKSYAGYINMSRIDPALLTPKTISKGSYVSFLLGQGAQLATCVSVIVVEESFIGQPGTTPYNLPKKEITGYFLTQEFERFAGVAGAVFGEERFSTYSFNGAFKFGTYVDPNRTGASNHEGGMFSAKPSPSSASSPTPRAVLSYDSVVPLYDYRSERTFDPAIHLNPTMYGKLLPSHRDLPRHSLALVAYTTSKFGLRSGDIGLGCNIMWAALLATPPGSSLPEPPSVLEQSPTKAAIARKKASKKI